MRPGTEPPLGETPMIVVERIAEVRRAVAEARGGGKRIGFVPTMGALHAGHGALVRRASREADYVVVSIFVNPAQFGQNEDLDKYPRAFDADCALCASEGASLIFHPSVREMYPTGAMRSFVETPGVVETLEGRTRPGHFRGVATVVLKLFQIVAPDIAYFGQKDAQQCLVIKQMVADFDLPIELGIEPTVRDGDGLALSSRNAYLSAEQREAALGISRSLVAARALFASGDRSIDRLRQRIRESLESVDGLSIDYAEVVDAETFGSVRSGRPVIALVAAWVGKTRLIDNVILRAEETECG